MGSGSHFEELCGRISCTPAVLLVLAWRRVVNNDIDRERFHAKDREGALIHVIAAQALKSPLASNTRYAAIADIGFP
jgi:hypothetical protein